MPLKSRTTLKSYFEANDRPTASQYIDLIDSIPNFVDDNPTYGFNWKGDWDNSIRYVKYDSVYYDVTGASYVCIKAHDAFFVPTNTTYWSKISEKGADAQDALGFTPEDVANKKTSLADNSDTFYPTQKAVKTAVDTKQATLVSGTNIKTINSQSLLGSGNINTPNTTYTSSDFDIKDLTDSTNLRTTWSGKQDTLGFTAENVANKVTSFQTTPTDTAYPSEKLVKDSLEGKIGSVVEDTTPQLGGQLDVNGKALGDGTLEILKFSETASAVNEITVKNAATGNAPEIQATGDNTNIDLKLVGKGTGGTIARIKPRIVTATSYTTDTGTSLNCDTTDQFQVTAQAGALKLNNPSGTATAGQKLIVRIKDNGTASALTYDTQFRAMGNALPSTTVLSKTLYMGFIYNSDDTKWDCVAVAQES